MTPSVRSVASVVALAGLLLAGPALASPSAGAGLDLMPVLLAMVLVLVGAQLGGALFARIGQPPVLGELLAGVLIGNLGLLGWHGLEGLRDCPRSRCWPRSACSSCSSTWGSARTSAQMLAVGGSSLLVATLGRDRAHRARLPGVALGFFPGAPPAQPLVRRRHAVRHQRRHHRARARRPGTHRRAARAASSSGAAVIDDVQGLMVLAVIKGVIDAVAGGQVFDAALGAGHPGQGGRLPGGRDRAGPSALAAACSSSARGCAGEGVLLLAGARLLLPASSWLAGWLGLAPIVGAFAAGLVLDEVHYRDLRARDRARRDVQTLLEPISTLPGAGLLRADGHARGPLRLRRRPGAWASPPRWWRSRW